MTDVTITLAGETLCLMPERAIHWPRTQTLFVADPHWGKAATFRARSIPVPETADADLVRLDVALTRTGARRLIILGDLLHARIGRAQSIFKQITAWRERCPALEILLIRGNHDRMAGDPPAEWQMTCVDAPYPHAPFLLQHEPLTLENPGGYALAGHLHPGARLTGAGRQGLIIPCFWFGEGCGVLPAFGSFTGCKPIQPKRSDGVYVVTEREVIRVSRETHRATGG